MEEGDVVELSNVLSTEYRMATRMCLRPDFAEVSLAMVVIVVIVVLVVGSVVT